MRYGFHPGWVCIAKAAGITEFAKLRERVRTLKITLTRFFLQLTDCSFFKVDMVEDKAALGAELERLDHANGQSSIGLGKSEVGGSVIDAV